MPIQPYVSGYKAVPGDSIAPVTDMVDAMRKRIPIREDQSIASYAIQGLLDALKERWKPTPRTHDIPLPNESGQVDERVKAYQRRGY